MNKTIALSTPHLGERERVLLLDAFDSNWVMLGPHVDAFEEEVARYVGVEHAVALASGTAALHLALVALGVGAGDEVWTSTLTFAATTNAISYTGARPVFIDSELESWNMDPELLQEALATARRRGVLPKVVMPVDIYGQTANYGRLLPLCEEYGVSLVEDAAEALGATCGGKRAGSFGVAAAVSFNGNKIITCGGGGMLLTNDPALAARARFLATQARDPAPHYQHSTIGYNYRLSNLLAAVGRGQLECLEERVTARRSNFEYYQEALADLPGLSFMPEANWGRCTRWLTCVIIDEGVFGASREELRLHLQAQGIEARPVWKPMHLQPVFANCSTVGGGVAAGLFDQGLCLPSGSNLERSDLERVAAALRSPPR